MSMLGPYASYNKETGYATWDHPTAEYVGIFERLNIQPKGIIHVGLWDFCENICYTKLVGNNVIGVEANKLVYETMSKPVADRCGYKTFNEYLYSEDGVEKDFYMAGHCSGLYESSENSSAPSVKVKTKTLSTLIKENDIDMEGYDFLNIDAEGAELDILKGFQENLSYINVIDLETSLDDRNNSGAFHDRIVDWLGKRGFELREMSPSYEQQQWGDSLFVRTTRKHTPFGGLI
jgi:FkbM family methyltransferase